MLTTTGRKSGRRRTIPLNALADGDRWVIVASNGGQPTHLQWYLNLLANPAVGLEVRRQKFTAAARRATPEEKAKLWPRIIARAKNYEGYQSKTVRDIPLVVLTRMLAPLADPSTIGAGPAAKHVRGGLRMSAVCDP
jgi:deazaflavin-dependent oxidoreductase (nitroreductase family)